MKKEENMKIERNMEVSKNKIDRKESKETQ